ncbi:MAG: shikimate kinase [Candidatus Eremiobacteraeota bacterium]|nr:shikimate kinase [Candidatus Eremiobacteraeota bacterium]
MNVALSGFMGAGKTTTGRHLARLLGVVFVDTDAEIERRHGAIAAIFAKQGEKAFRGFEARVIGDVTGGAPAVIAVGGGAVLDETNRRRLRETGLLVHLQVSALTAYRRVLRRHHRPLLGAQPDLDAIRRLLDARTPAYADCDLVVQVDHKTPLAAARIIARWYADRATNVAR